MASLWVLLLGRKLSCLKLMIDWMLLILYSESAFEVHRTHRAHSVSHYFFCYCQQSDTTKTRRTRKPNPMFEGEPAPTAHKTLSHLLDMQIKVTVFALMLG
jgi:hypothetical protein